MAPAAQRARHRLLRGFLGGRAIGERDRERSGQVVVVRREELVEPATGHTKR